MMRLLQIHGELFDLGTLDARMQAAEKRTNYRNNSLAQSTPTIVFQSEAVVLERCRQLIVKTYIRVHFSQMIRFFRLTVPLSMF